MGTTTRVLLVAIFTAIGMTSQCLARTNKGAVQKSLRNKHDRVIFGKELDHVEYLQLAASIAIGPGAVAGYLGDLAREIASETGRTVAKDTIYDILRGNRDTTIIGGKPVYMGLATYNHWTIEGGPLFEIRVPRPNTHQFYVAIGKRSDRPTAGAAIRGAILHPTAATMHPNGKAYFFRGDKYQRYDFTSDKVDKVGRTGTDGWSGVWKGGVDAAVLHPNGKAYFFRGDKYQRYDFKSEKVDRLGRIDRDGWSGVWTEGMDAATMHPNGKAYFFRGDEYQRYDFKKDKVDRVGRIGRDGWWGVWTQGVDMAILHPNGKVYFFRGDEYQRYDIIKEKVDRTGRVGASGWWGFASQ